MAARATATPAPTKLEQLAAEFPGSDVKTRNQAGQTLTYIDISATIRRLNEVLGSAWSTDATTTVTEAGENYLAVCELRLTATLDPNDPPTVKYGVGADKGKDVDKIVKTALAEALKKAGHQLGIALYLWDPAGRARAESRMKLAKATDPEATLKRAVFDLAEQKLGKKPTSAAQVAKVFGVTAGELADKAVLVSLLEAEGVL